jgi:hypothetical protein
MCVGYRQIVNDHTVEWCAVQCSQFTHLQAGLKFVGLFACSRRSIKHLPPMNDAQTTSSHVAQLGAIKRAQKAIRNARQTAPTSSLLCACSVQTMLHLLAFAQLRCGGVSEDAVRRKRQRAVRLVFSMTPCCKTIIARLQR